MTSKGLKPALSRPAPRDALAAADVVAWQAGLLPATLAPRTLTGTQRKEAADTFDLVQVNIRVRRGLGDQLADRARSEGATQKVLICRALAAVGFDVDPGDLRAPAAPRRRGRAG